MPLSWEVPAPLGPALFLRAGGHPLPSRVQPGAGAGGLGLPSDQLAVDMSLLSLGLSFPRPSGCQSVCLSLLVPWPHSHELVAGREGRVGGRFLRKMTLSPPLLRAQGLGWGLRDPRL